MATTDAGDASQVVLVTGPAGAGRTTAIRALEDLGHEAIDNMPLALLPRLLDGPPLGPLAIGVDPRTRDFSVGAVMEAIEAIAAEGRHTLALLYVDCAPRVLLQRYSETRRRHPSSPGSAPLVGIEREIAMLAPLMARADVLIDTTMLTPHALRAEIARHFGHPGGGMLAVTLMSFSYKKGAEAGLDMMIDVRFLRNPHWDEALRPLDGRDAPVVAHIEEDARWAPFMERLSGMMAFLLPAYREEGKSHFTLGVGCTGGRHRSVATVEALAKALARAGWQVSTHHRDLMETTEPVQEARDGIVVS